jgi:hypothetical protein
MAGLQMKEPHEWHLVDDVMVTFTIAGTISDRLWDRFIADLKNNNVRVIFSCADNGNISSSQRKLTSETLQAKNIYAVVVTNSRITRGMLTAISWLGGQLNGFSWDDLDGALKAAQNPKVENQIRDLALSFRKMIGA